MKKIANLFVICIALVGFLMLVSCGETPAKCEHETGSWAANATEHWKTCSKCNKQVEKGAHAFGEYEEITKPAVGVEGLEARKCADCGYVDRKTIPALVVTTGVAEGDFAVYAKVPADWETVNCYYFGEDKNPLENTVSWPGQEMTLVNAEENVWGYVVPAGTGYVIFNNGSAQTIDLLFATELNYYVLQEGSDGKYTADYQLYTPAADQPELNKYPSEIAPEETYPLYVQLPETWTAPNAYWWGGKGSDAWPGNVLINVEGNVWTIDLSKSATGLIFNNDGVQTGNIESLGGLHAGNAFIVNEDLTFVPANYNEGVFEPVNLEVEVPTDCYIKGSMNNWSPVAEYQFNYDAATDSATFTVEIEQDAQFKVTVGPEWSIEFNSGNTNFPADAFADDGGNIKCIAAGKYVFTITDVTKGIRALTISLPAEYALYVQLPEAWTAPNAHWWGGKVDTQWPGNPLTNVEGNVWTIELPRDVTGLIFNCDGAQTVNIVDLNGLHAGNAFVVNEDLTFAAANYKEGVFEAIEVKVEVPTDCYVKGGMNNWSAVAEYQFSYDEATDSATITVEIEQDAQFKVTVGPEWSIEFNSGNTNFPADAFADDGGNIKCIAAGKYVFTITDVTKDTRALTIAVAE